MTLDRSRLDPVTLDRTPNNDWPVVRSADSIVREAGGSSSRGHGCPRSKAVTRRQGCRRSQLVALQLGLLVVTIVFLLTGGRTFSHTLPISYLFVVTDVDYVHVELSFNPFELASFSEIDTNKNGRLDPPEVKSQDDRITRLLLENLTLTVDGNKVSAETAGISPEADSHHAVLRAHYRVKAHGATVAIESSLQKVTSSSHLTQVKFLSGGEQHLAQLDSQSGKVMFKPVGPKQAAGKPAVKSQTTEIKKP